MGKNSFLFIIFCVSLSFAWVEFRHAFERFYGDEKFLRQELVQQERKTELEKIKIAKLQNQLTDVRVEMAKLDLKDLKSATWVQALRWPASEGAQDLSAAQFESARALFRQKEYAAAAKAFDQVIEDFPIAPSVHEAAFLRVESYFLSGDLVRALDSIDFMLDQYPDQLLTGYALLRMGQIYQQRNQAEKAVEVFRIVQHQFGASSELGRQAQFFLKDLGVLP